MSETRFREIVDTYSADEARWPQAEHALALAFVRENKVLAKALLEQARNLDALLDFGHRTFEMPDRLKMRILEQARTHIRGGVSTDDVPDAHFTRIPGVHTPWKTLAATLMVTTGTGFGAGQLAAAQSDAETAETLIAYSTSYADFQTDWAEPEQ